MAVKFPEPTDPCATRADVFLGYLDYFRGVVVDKLSGLSDEDLRGSRLPSGWSPLELLKHLIQVEIRWLVWGFEGEPIRDPWADERNGRWHVDEEETLSELVASLQRQSERTRSVVDGHALSDVGRPGEGWDGESPPTLERVLFHLVQEYARHVGHLDVVRELIDGRTGDAG